MLDGIEIRNFKGIRNGEFKSFGEINVFIGPNNSGKSTILDSIYLLNHFFSPHDILGNYIPRYLTAKKAGNTNFESLHWKYNQNVDSIIKPVVSLDKEEKIGVGLEYNMLEWKFQDKFLVSDEIEDDEINREINTGGRRSYESITKYLSKSNNSVLSNYLNSLQGDLSNTYYIHSGVFQVLEQVENQVWGGLYQDRSDKKVISKLNEIYDTKVDQLSYVPRGEDPELQILFDDYAAEPGSLGDGFRYAFALFAGIEAYSPNTILIEEPENHQHPSAYEGIANSIVEYSTDDSKQFFVATHSLDFLSYLAEESREKGIEMNIYHLGLNDGDLDVREIDNPDIEMLQDLGIDPRRLNEYGGDNFEH